MIGVLVCAAFSLAIFALAARADAQWPERLSRRGHQLKGEKWRGQWGATSTYARAKLNRQVLGGGSQLRAW
jgi:hypothetical protein